MMLPDAAGGQVAITFGMRGPNLGLISACATGSNAIGEAAEAIRRGSADVMVAGGAEAAHRAAGAGRLQQHGRHVHPQ